MLMLGRLPDVQGAETRLFWRVSERLWMHCRLYLTRQTRTVALERPDTADGAQLEVHRSKYESLFHREDIPVSARTCSRC